MTATLKYAEGKKKAPGNTWWQKRASTSYLKAPNQPPLLSQTLVGTYVETCVFGGKRIQSRRPWSREGGRERKWQMTAFNPADGRERGLWWERGGVWMRSALESFYYARRTVRGQWMNWKISRFSGAAEPHGRKPIYSVSIMAAHRQLCIQVQREGP